MAHGRQPCRRHAATAAAVGRPPTGTAVIAVVRSAEIVCVTREKMHAPGSAGGCAYARMTDAGISSFGSVPAGEQLGDGAARSARSSRSGESSPICGVYRLIQIRFVVGCPLQKPTNSAR